MVVGERLQERYRLDERIATGGMGAVFAAHDERLNRKVAVKLLKDDLAGDIRFVERFRREARAVASLSHPNIANVFDYGEDDERYFIVMEFAPGADLARLLRGEGPLEPQRAAIITEQVCAALDHAHTAGIVHRDVKPANVMVDAHDHVKVTDFGIARAMGDSTLTATGSVLGTAHYLSPEQADGGDIGPAADIYSLGIVLFEMLTGSAPFSGDTPIAIAMRQVSDPVPPPSDRIPGVPPAYDAVVARATAKRPAERFRDAQEMGAAVAAARRGDAPTAAAAPAAALGVAPPPTAELSAEEGPAVWPIPGGRWDSRRAGRVVLASFVALGLLLGALLLWRVMTPAPEATRGNEGGPATEETSVASPTSSPTVTPSPTGFIIQDAIIGMEFKEVEKQLRAAGLEVSRVDVPSEEDKDTVIASDPEPGSRVEAGDEITLFVSTGSDDDDDGPGEGKGKDKQDNPGRGDDD